VLVLEIQIIFLDHYSRLLVSLTRSPSTAKEELHKDKLRGSNVCNNLNSNMPVYLRCTC